MSLSDNTDGGDGLPKQFVSSLRILFEILDETRSGYVRLCDIESRWSENGVKGLPLGVVEALRKVTPPNGLLSFSKFVAGLKLALLRNKVVNGTGAVGKENRGPGHHVSRGELRGKGDPPPRVQSQPPPQTNRYVPQHAPPVTAVKPNNANYRSSYTNPSQSDNIYTSSGDLYRPPPRPDRPSQFRKTVDLAPPDVPPRDRTKGGRVLHELKNWQRERVIAPSGENRDQRPQSTSDKFASSTSGRNDPYAIYANIEQFQRKNNEDPSKPPVQSNSQSGPSQQSKPDAPQKPVRRQNSARRHTLSSGLDYNAIKRMKQFEEERDMLLQGLEIVDQAREWYRKQISAIQEKQKYVGKGALNEHSLEAHQERMNFQKARIVEVNQQLKTLTESSEKGFPLHMNLALGPRNPQPQVNTVKMLKDQNRLLTNEVSHKSDKITQLEQEKATLIRELFEARSKHKTNYDDTTFM